jgi:hypothetical protein
VCQIYVDDIIFCSTNEKICEEFSKVMTNRFEMSMMGELKFFLGFKVKQLRENPLRLQWHQMDISTLMKKVNR